MGDAVNLGARLMAHASKHDLKVLCDTATYKQSDVKTVNMATAVEYKELPAVRGRVARRRRLC